MRTSPALKDGADAFTGVDSTGAPEAEACLERAVGPEGQPFAVLPVP